MSDLSSVGWTALLSIAGSGGGKRQSGQPRIPQGPGSKEAAHLPNRVSQHLSPWDVRIRRQSLAEGLWWFRGAGLA